jgi:hypothetical protein
MRILEFLRHFVPQKLHLLVFSPFPMGRGLGGWDDSVTVVEYAVIGIEE